MSSLKGRGLPHQLPILAPNSQFKFADIGAEERRQQLDWRSWYGLQRWKDLRWSVLVRDKFTCQMPHCKRLEPVTSELVADHIVPHRGDPKLFWDEKNLRCLCRNCHDTVKKSEEMNERQF